MLFLVFATGTSAVAAPPDFSAVAQQRHQWLKVYEAAIVATPNERRVALQKLIDEARKQIADLKGLQIRRLGTGEHLVAPFSLLPVHLEFSEKLAVSDGSSWKHAYYLARARRELSAAWSRDPPKGNSSLSRYRSWARTIQLALPSISANFVHLARSRRDETLQTSLMQRRNDTQNELALVALALPLRRLMADILRAQRWREF